MGVDYERIAENLLDAMHEVWDLTFRPTISDKEAVNMIEEVATQAIDAYFVARDWIEPEVKGEFRLCDCGNLLTIADRGSRCRQCVIGVVQHG